MLLRGIQSEADHPCAMYATERSLIAVQNQLHYILSTKIRPYFVWFQNGRQKQDLATFHPCTKYSDHTNLVKAHFSNSIRLFNSQ